MEDIPGPEGSSMLCYSETSDKKTTSPHSLQCTKKKEKTSPTFF